MRSGEAFVDFDALIYVSPPPQSLFCPVCKNILQAPLETSCAHRHTMCSRCLEQALEDKLECPVDRTPMPGGLSDCRPACKLISQVIDELETSCPNMRCGRILPRGNVEWHLREQCPFEQIKCPATLCEQLVLRKDIVGTQCNHILNECEHCSQEIMANRMSDHLNECPELSHQCQYCLLEYSAEDMSHHVCSQEPIICGAAAFGCSATGTRESMTAHSQSCSVLMMVPYLKSQQDKIANLELENRMLRQSIHSLELVETLEPVVEVSSEYERDRNHLFESLSTLSTGMENMSVALTALDTKQSHLIMNESMRTKDEMAMLRAGLQGLRMQWHHFLQNTRGPFSAPEQVFQNLQQPPEVASTRGAPVRLSNDGSRVKL